MDGPARLRLLVLSAMFAGHATSTPGAAAANMYWDGSGTGWNSASSWSTSASATTPDPATPPGAADVAIFSIASVVSSQTVSLNAAQSALGLAFNSGGSVGLQNGAGTNTLTIGTSGITVNPGAGTVTISPTVTLAGTQTWTNSSIAPLTVGNIALANNPLTLVGAGSGGISFTGALSGGAATLTLAGGSATLSGSSANTYTGTTTVNAGTLTLNKTVANSTVPGDLVIGDGLGGANADIVSISSSNQISDSSAVTINSSGVLQCPGSQEYVSSITMNAGNISTTGIGSISMAVLNTNANANTATIIGSLNLNGSTTANVGAGTTAAGIDVDVQATLTNGTLTKNGTGVMKLSGTVDNAGTTLNITNGTILLAKTSTATVHAISGNLVIAGGTAQLAGSGGDQIPNATAVTAGSAIAAGTFDTHGQNETLAALNLLGNGIDSGGALLNTTGSSILTVTTATNLGGDSSLGVNTGASLTLTSQISGAYGLTKVGAGTLTLTGSAVNTYSGITTVNGGVLTLNKSVPSSAIPGDVVINSTAIMRLGADHQISDASTITVTAGGTFDSGTFKENVAKVVLSGGSITGSTNDFRVSNQDALTSVASSITALVSGQLSFTSGAGSTIAVAAGSTPSGIDLDLSANTNWTGVLTKSGPGAMRVSAANLNSSGVVVDGGKLLVANNSALGTGTITFNSGAIAADGAARTLNNPIVVQTAANAAFTGSYDLTLSGPISGAGQLTKTGAGTLTLTASNTFAGPVNVNGGALALSGGSLTANLVNSASFVYNAGTFAGRLTNAGTITFNADFSAGNGLENDAALSIPLGRAVALNGLGLDNEGTLTMAGGALNLSTALGAANVNRGTFNLSATIPFNLNGATLSNNGTFNLSSGTIMGTSGLLSNGVGGTISGNGAVLSPFVNAGGTIVVGSGTTNISQPFSNSGYIHLTSATSSLTGGAIATSGAIDGLGTIGNNVTNTGTIEASGGTLTLGGLVSNNEQGRILAPAGSRVLFSGTSASNSATMNFSGGTFEFTQAATNAAAGTISGRGTLITGGAGLWNLGSINFTSGTSDVFGKLANNTGFSNKGVSIAAGAATTFWGGVTNAAGSLFRVSPGSSATLFGTYGGAGITGGGQVNFEADVSPGFSPASVTFAANVAIGSTAKLAIELGGTIPGTQFDQLQVTGLLSLDGTLGVSLVNGFTPSAGNSFDILDWSSVTGTFSFLELPALPATLQWNTSQLYTTGTLSVAAVALLGDFNHNAVVDTSDYITWRKGLGTSYSPTDYNLWRTHFGQTAGIVAGGTSVPEPATFIRAILTAAAILIRLRRRFGE